MRQRARSTISRPISLPGSCPTGKVPSVRWWTANSKSWPEGGSDHAGSGHGAHRDRIRQFTWYRTYGGQVSRNTSLIGTLAGTAVAGRSARDNPSIGQRHAPCVDEV